ncbi:MAG: PQQ-binding-like beta-propeller repeat protein [Planctomycetota bacterium]
MKNARYWLCAAALIAGAGCLNVQNRRPIESPRVVRTDGALGRPPAPEPIEADRLKSFGMELFWNSWLRDEQIAKLQLEANPVTGTATLYAYTESNRLYQIDVSSGKVNWVFDVGKPLAFAEQERPICEFNYPKDETLRRYDEVFFVAKDTIYALDKQDGSELWRLNCGFNPSGPPQATITHVMIGSWDQRVYAIAKSAPQTYDWMYRTEAEVTARAAQRSPSAFVASMDGKLYVFDATKGQLVTTLRTEKPLSSDPLVYRDLLYVGGEDYNLYVWSALDQFPHFRYATGAPIKRAPVAIKNPTEKGKSTDTIYVKTEGPEGGILAILRGNKLANSQKLSHEFIWKRDGAEQVLARGRDTAFLLEPPGKDAAARSKRVVKVDAKNAYVRDEVTVSGVDYFLTNPLDPNDKKLVGGGLVLMGYRNGWLVAYKERSPYPAD